MSVNYDVPLLTARLQLVIDQIDAGVSNGFMRLRDTGGSVLSSFQLARPMGVAAAGLLSFNGLSLIDPAAAASGIATAATVETSSGFVVISGLTAGHGGAFEVQLSPNNNIVAGQTLSLTAATIRGN